MEWERWDPKVRMDGTINANCCLMRLFALYFFFFYKQKNILWQIYFTKGNFFIIENLLVTFNFNKIKLILFSMTNSILLSTKKNWYYFSMIKRLPYIRPNYPTTLGAQFLLHRKHGWLLKSFYFPPAPTNILSLRFIN